MGLCQPDQRGKLRLTMRSSGLEELYDALGGPLIIFHHHDHSCTVIFQFHCISTVPVIWQYY
jgi:hypothetical protein